MYQQFQVQKCVPLHEYFVLYFADGQPDWYECSEWLDGIVWGDALASDFPLLVSVIQIKLRLFYMAWGLFAVLLLATAIGVQWGQLVLKLEGFLFNWFILSVERAWLYNNGNCCKTCNWFFNLYILYVQLFVYIHQYVIFCTPFVIIPVMSYIQE